METVSATVLTEAGRLSGSPGFIYLAEIEQRTIGGVWRVALGWDREVTYDPDDRLGPRTYAPLGGAVEEVSQEDGTLDQLQITVSNVGRVLQSKFENDLLQGQPIRLLLVSAGDLDIAGHHYPLEWLVLHATMSPETGTIVVGAPNLMQMPFTRDRFLPDKCRLLYKDARCKAVAASTTCNKQYVSTDGCSGRENQANFGGFPHMLKDDDGLMA